MTNKKFSWGSLSEARGELYGFSTLWIMLFHSYLCGIEHFTKGAAFHWLDELIQYGNMGCELFILLSGVSMYFSYHKTPEALPFYRKRLNRLYLPVWIIWGPYWILSFSQGRMSLSELLLNFSFLRFFIDGHGNIWFLCLMLICYLAYPLLYRLLCGGWKKGLFWTVVLCTLSTLLLYFVKQRFPGYYEDTEILWHRVPVFFIGCFLGPFVYNKKETGGWLILVSLFGVVSGFDLMIRGHLEHFWFRSAYLPTGFCLLVLLAFIFTAMPVKPLSAVLRFFGKISLECYLAHMMLLRLYDRNLFIYKYVSNSRGRYLGLLLTAVVLAWAVNFVLSLPGRRKKKTT